MTLIRPPEPAWISTLEAEQRRVLRAFLRAGERPSSFWAGPGGVVAGDPGIYVTRGLDLISYAATTQVVGPSDGLPSHVLLTSDLDVDNPASFFSVPDGRCFEIAEGFGFASRGVVISPPSSPMRGVVFWGYGVIGEGNVHTARALGFAYDLGAGDTAQWYAQARADTGDTPTTRIPLGEFGMTLLGGEIYDFFIIVERGVRVAHVIIHRVDTGQAWGRGFTDADGLPTAGVYGYIEPVATSGGEPDDEPLTPRTSRVCAVWGYTRDDFSEAA